MKSESIIKNVQTMYNLNTLMLLHFVVDEGPNIWTNLLYDKTQKH